MLNRREVFALLVGAGIPKQPKPKTLLFDDLGVKVSVENGNISIHAKKLSVSDSEGRRRAFSINTKPGPNQADIEREL